MGKRGKNEPEEVREKEKVPRPLVRAEEERREAAAEGRGGERKDGSKIECERKQN